MEAQDARLLGLHESRRQFLALVADLRPELHRYCARMTGSVAEGEDIVQDTLARAYYLLPDLPRMPALRPWLFRIAHHRAIDHLRRYDRRMGEPLDDTIDEMPDAGSDPEDSLAREQAVFHAVSRFMQLAPVPRSCVILKDVLGHSLDEITALLELSLPAVKAALHRGRARLRDAGGAADAPPAAGSRAPSPAVARYAALFNARDWDGVRALLSDDVRLDLVTRAQREGRRDVGVYFANYDRFDDWRLIPAWLAGREVVAVFRHPLDARPGYFIELDVRDGQVTRIRDFRYVPYIANEAEIALS